MTQPATPFVPAPTTATPATPTTPTTLEERAAAALDDLRSSDRADRAAAPIAPTEAPPAAGAVAQVVGAKTPEQLVQERRDRLAAIHARNRARVDEKHRQSEGDKTARELARAREDLAVEQRRTAALVDPAKLDPASFIELAERTGVDVKQLGEWMRRRISSPEAIAEQTANTAARRVVDPELAAMRAELAKATEEIQTFQATQQRAAAEAAEQQATQEFCSLVSEQAAAAPFAANFLKQHGQDEFYKLAIGAARQAPGADWQGILDQIEENLGTLAHTLGALPPAPSQAQAQSAPAAAKATTVSNALAATRTAISADEDWSKLSLDERARRLSADDADW